MRSLHSLLRFIGGATPLKNSVFLLRVTPWLMAFKGNLIVFACLKVYVYLVIDCFS